MSEKVGPTVTTQGRGQLHGQASGHVRDVAAEMFTECTAGSSRTDEVQQREHCLCLLAWAGSVRRSRQPMVELS